MPITLLLHGHHVPPQAGAAGQAGPTVLYQPFGPWLVPWRFGSTEAEYQALRTGAGLIDYSTQAVIEVTGADRVSFLHNLLSQDLKQLTPGQARPAALLTPNGKLIATLLVFARPESFWLLCDVTHAQTLTQTLDRYLFSEAVTLTNHERAKAVFACEGSEIPERLTRWKDTQLHLIHHSLIGGRGMWLMVDADHAQRFWTHGVQRGTSLGFTPVGWEALNIARIEAGIPWFGIDFDESNLLPETGLETMLASDSKGCYVGQEIVARLQTYGSANKKLMGLRIESEEVPAVDDVVMRNGEEVGRVTSACYSLERKHPMAIAMIKRGSYDAGTPVELTHGSERLAAVVTPLANSARTPAGG